MISITNSQVIWLEQASKQLQRYLRDQNMRLTPERESLLKVIVGFRSHFTPEEVCRELKKHDCPASLVTVYRNLPMLCEAGILRRTCLSANDSFYEVIWGEEHHDHIICGSCGAVTEFQYEAIEILQEAVAKKFGYRLTGHHLELIGVCTKCQKKEGKTAIFK